MTTHHTPAPWHIFQPPGGHLHINHNLAPVARIEDQKQTAQEAKANARLIAAAPDLLSALLALQSHFPKPVELGSSLADSVNKARAAIAKATQA